MPAGLIHENKAKNSETLLIASNDNVGDIWYLDSGASELEMQSPKKFKVYEKLLSKPKMGRLRRCPRFGHLNFWSLNELSNKSIVQGFLEIDAISEVCKDYSLQTKLDDKAEKCIFIGYSERTKAYKFYNPKTKKFVISRDVRFDEKDSFDFSDYSSSSDLQILDFEEGESKEVNQNNGDRNDGENKRAQDSPLTAKRQTRSFRDIYDETKELDATNQTKTNQDGSVNKYKARLVAKGYKQKEGEDFNEVFDPLSRLDTIRLIISLAAQNGWKLFQMDVKLAFWNGYLQEEIYLEQPLGFVRKCEEDKVYKLKKTLYGLKQSPRAWYGRINDYFIKFGFEKCHFEHTLYIKKNPNEGVMVVSLYADNLIFTDNHLKMLMDFKISMMNEFDRTDLEELHNFLGINVEQSKAGIFISQEKYATEILNMYHCKINMEKAHINV
ncbi:uncharacterized protein [Henckelia pumila]|uniref:uncharacterized protein n=1 Tax=Henckelia pumila TaxID=405737 RepID=UPI003C6E5FFE